MPFLKVYFVNGISGLGEIGAGRGIDKKFAQAGADLSPAGGVLYT